MVRRRCCIRLFLGLLLALDGFTILIALPERAPLDPRDCLRFADIAICLDRSSNRASCV